MGNHFLNYLLLYLLVVNLYGFLIMKLDKRKAKRNEWRYREKTLVLIAVLGGAIGMLAGTRVFRHKTKKPLFQLGLPIIIIGQFIGFIYWYSNI